MSDVSNITQSQSQMSKKDKPCSQRRRVTFSTEANAICYLRNVAPSTTLTNEERNSAWYTHKEMIQMKEEAKTLARSLRVVVCKETYSAPPRSGNDGTQIPKTNSKRRLIEKYPLDFTASSSAAIKEENANGNYRGLELSIFLGRQIKKYFATRKILEYQRKYKLMIAIAKKSGNPNIQFLTEDLSKKLGFVSAKYSRWARKMAFVTGQSDFLGVYKQSESPILLTSFEQLDLLSSKRKRTIQFSSSVMEFEMNSSNKKHCFGSQKPAHCFFIATDRMRGGMLPVNIF